MKNKKWLTYTLGILLTLIVLVAVGGAGFRMGMMQSASFANLTDGQSAQAPFFHHGQGMDGNFVHGQGMMDGNYGYMECGNMSRGFERGRGGSPLFGLFHLIVFGVLAWFGYKLVKNSGWKLVKVNANEADAPAVEQPSAAVTGDEKKETE